MLFKVDNKILTGSGGFLQINPDGKIVFRFEVRGTLFPSKRTQGDINGSLIRFTSRVANKVFIDFGDNTGEQEYQFYVNGSTHRISFRNLSGQTTPATVQGTTWDDAPIYYYQDLPPGKINTVDESYDYHRVISIRFEKPQEVVEFQWDLSYIYGVLPSAFSKMRELKTLRISQTQYITEFQQDFYNSRIENLYLSAVGSIMNEGIPNWVLNSIYLKTLNMGGSVDLSGSPVDKKLIQINKLKDSLNELGINSSGINYQLPDAVGELYNLNTLSINLNNSTNLRMPEDLSGFLSLHTLYCYGTNMPFSEVERIISAIPALRYLEIANCGYNANYDFLINYDNITDIDIGGQTWGNDSVPDFISKLTNLKALRIGMNRTSSVSSVIRYYGDFSSLTSLTALYLNRLSMFTTEIPSWFSSLINLKTIHIYASFQNSGGIDSYVDSIYDFIVSNAAMLTGNTQFRNMSFVAYAGNVADQNNSTRPSGTYQQPSGYIQGSSNGTPASAMEKIWVLVNQYGHTWTVKPA